MRQAKQGIRSLPFLKAVFDAALNVKHVSQPLTAAAWNFEPLFKPINDFVLSASNVYSFHCYLPPQRLLERIIELKQLGRPLLCTEHMARGAGSNFEHCLSILKNHKIAAIN